MNRPGPARGIMIGLAVTLVVCLLALAIGVAATRAAAPDDARLGWFEPVARAAWPDSPCTGREVVHLDADAFMASVARAANIAPGSLYGLASPGACEVWIRSGLDSLSFCITLVHELGHLAGREHSTVPGDVMNGDILQAAWPPCDQAVLHASVAGVHRSHRAARRHRKWWAWGRDRG